MIAYIVIHSAYILRPHILTTAWFSWSVRVSNELGAGHPRAAKFSIVVSVLTSAFFGILFTVLILATESQFPKMFTDKPVVIRETSKLGYYLAATIFLNSIQAVLLGNCNYIQHLFIEEGYAQQIPGISILFQKNLIVLHPKSLMHQIFPFETFTNLVPSE